MEISTKEEQELEQILELLAELLLPYLNHQ